MVADSQFTIPTANLDYFLHTAVHYLYLYHRSLFRSKAPPVVYLAVSISLYKPISVSVAEVYIRCALFAVGMVGN